MSKIEKYTEMGFDDKTAEYFAGGRRRIVTVSPQDDFALVLTFDNGEARLLDCKPFLKPGTVFEPFMQIENFKRVYIDDCNCVAWDIDPNIDSDVVWSNKVDLCPDTCYMDSMPIVISAEEIHAELAKGLADVEAGRYQDAAKVLEDFRRNL